MFGKLGAEMPPWTKSWSCRSAVAGLAGDLLALAFCCALACPVGAWAAPQHPLDPLTADELVATRDVLVSSGRFSPDTKFAWIGLEEPAKTLVEGFTPG